MESSSFRGRGSRPGVLVVIGLLSILLFGARRLAGEINGAESAKGVSPQSTFTTSGIDRVNVFNGNVVVEIPIGPDYPIGSDLTQQLRLVYNSQLWQSHIGCEYVDPTRQPPPPPTTYYGFHLTGASVLGAGWRLDFGRINEGDTTSYFKYVAPDGGVHQLAPNLSYTDWRSADRTYLRSVNPVFGTTNPLRDLRQADVLFPNGHTGQFRQNISSVPHGSTSQDFDSEGIYLTRLSNRRGDWVEVAYVLNYEVADGAWRIATVKHYSQGVLIPNRTIKFHYTTVTVDSRPWGGPTATVDTWTVLSTIEFPSVSTVAFPSGSKQTMQFTYYTDGFARPDTDVTYQYCGATATRREVAAPLLKRVQLDSGDPTLFYDFDYYRSNTGVDTRSGAIKQLTLPAGGVVQYQWTGIGTGFPLSMPPELSFLTSGLTGVSRRTEYPDGLSGSSGAWTYSYTRWGAFGPPNKYARNDVTAPDGYMTRHYFYVDPGSGGNGLEYRAEIFDLASQLTRREEKCYDDDEGHMNVCAAQFVPDSLRANSRVSRDDVSVMTGGGAVAQTQSTRGSAWDGYGHFGRRDVYGWNGALLRTTQTAWAPDTANWILDEYRTETVTDWSAPAGQQVETRFAEFDSTGFLKGMFVYDAARALAFLNCRYPEPGTWNLQKEFTATLTNQSSAPAYNICSLNYGTMPSVGGDGDMFGRYYTYQNGQLVSKRWIQGSSPAAWFELDLYRDPVTGDPLVSWDVAAQPTYYGYDVLRRPRSAAPPGEAATYATYDSPVQATVTRSSGSLNTWSRSITDGFGRPRREIRKMPGAGYATRIQGYDSVGRSVFASEWASCGDAASCASAGVTAGNRASNFDPFGRPQVATGPDGSIRNISYADGSVPFSDTKRSWTVNNVNGSCSGGTCTSGTSATTVHGYDALGRLVSTAEPGVASATTYVYEVGGRVASVAQGAQTRNFVYDPAGNLRSENTPERGSITYDRYGSLGNLLQETHGASSLVRATCYDFAGRALGIRTNEDGVAPKCSPAAGRIYLLATWNDTVPDASLGRLVNRSAVNYGTATTTTVADSYSYLGPGGRLSGQTTSVSGAGSLTATQRWLYNGLGLVEHHYHPVVAASRPFVVSTVYDAGLPVAEYANGIPVVAAATYQPSGALRSYSTGVGIGSNVTTAATYDASVTSRVTGISTSGASSNFASGSYGYDGAGNVTAIGADRFTYDSLSRLVRSDLVEGTEAYAYDQFGNLLSKGATTFCTTICSGNRLPGKTYDTRGNLTGDVAQPALYTYDGLNRAVRQNQPVTWAYVFDGRNERVAKAPPAGAWTYTLRDPGGRVVSEFSGSSPSRENVYLAGRLVASYANSAVTGNGPVWTFYANDHLGTPRLITDLRGATVEARKYRPYGEELGTPSLFQSVRFASMERDLEGTRYYDHARSEDFSIGRFLTPDRASADPTDPQSWNRYTYVRNNPLRYSDPTGLFFVEGGARNADGTDFWDPEDCDDAEADCPNAQDSLNGPYTGTFETVQPGTEEKNNVTVTGEDPDRVAAGINNFVMGLLSPGEVVLGMINGNPGQIGRGLAGMAWEVGFHVGAGQILKGVAHLASPAAVARGPITPPAASSLLHNPVTETVFGSAMNFAREKFVEHLKPEPRIPEPDLPPDLRGAGMVCSAGICTPSPF